MQTIKLPEEKIGENTDDLEFGDEFLDATPKVQYMKEKKKKTVRWASLKLNLPALHTAPLREQKEKPPTGTTLAKSDEGLPSKMDKAPLKLSDKGGAQLQRG